MASLYADEDFPRPVVLLLRAAGHDVVTVQDRGRAGTPDPVILALATAEGRAVLTHDDDYRTLHRVTPVHAGIVHPTRDSIAALAARIDQRLLAEGDLTNKLVRVTKPHPGTPP